MDIYLCSTVRNLLFALLKGLSTPHKRSYLIMVTDQQHIDVDNYYPESLPKYIKVIFIKRADVNGYLRANSHGKLIKILAKFYLYTTPALQSHFKKILFTTLIPIKEDIKVLKNASLYLFNDRSKLARLLRLGFKEYAIIEDGLSNYRGVKFKLFEKIKHFLTFSKQKKRYFGDNSRCKFIYLLKAENAPQYLQKKIIKIDFIDPLLINKYCLAFFKADMLNEKPQYILATQPISIGAFSELGFDLCVYEKVLKYLQSKNISCVLKVHPREKLQRFRDRFPETQLIDSKIPLELILFNNKSRCNIISIYSTAGMGFEDFCRRITLIEDNEAENINTILAAWKSDAAQIERQIERKLVDVE